MTDTRLAMLLFAAAFLARLIAATGSAIFGTDGGHYLLMADWMREGRFHEALLLTYHPLYPLLTAALRSVTPSTELAGELVSTTLGSAAAIPLFAAVRGVFGRPTAFLTGLIYAFGHPLVEVQSDVMTEGAYFFFLFGTLWLTFRMTAEPGPVRGAVLGASAAAAFLTRPEGLLAIALSLAWPAVFILRHHRAPALRIAGIATTALVILLMTSPYLFWVKVQRGHWALSVRPSAIAGERSLGAGAQGEETADSQAVLYRQYARALFRLSGVMIPFFLLGLPSLRKVDMWNGLLYFSFPVGQLIGILVAMRRHNFMSERYLLAGMTLLMPVAALGILRVLDWLSHRPGPAGRPALGAVLVLLLTVAPGVRCLRLRRVECLSFPAAARWIQSQPGPRPRGMSGPVEQVAYLCGTRSYYTPAGRDDLRQSLKTLPVDYLVYSEKDVTNRAEYVRMLRSCEELEPAVAIAGTPGTWTVYIHRVK